MSGDSSGNFPELAPKGKAGAEDEVDLLELWRVLVKYKRMILIATAGAAIAAAGVSLMMHNIYRGEVLIAPAQNDDAKGGVASALGGMSGLASLAGISLSSGNSTDEALAVLKSREFLWKFVQEKNLMPILFESEWDEQQQKWKQGNPKEQPGQMDVFRLFNEGGVLKAEADKKTRLVTVSVEWKDAALAADWANALVEHLNQYLAQQAISRTERNLKYLNEELMRTQADEIRKPLFDLIANEQKNAALVNTQKEFAFKVLDPAVKPDKKIKPGRLLIVTFTAFGAWILTIIFAFGKESIGRRRKEEARQAAVE